MNTTEHQHTWQPVDIDPTVPPRYACTDCDATVDGCNTCGQPLATSLATCDRCIQRARWVVTDTADAIATVPFHHAEILGLRAIRYDTVRVTTSDDDARLPFGLDRIVEDPDAVGQRIEAAKHPTTAIDVLADWANAWADHLDKPAGHDWAVFLVEHTVWASQNPDQSGWHDYLTEARRVRTTVRRLLGLEPERQPAPCVHCGSRIVQDWTPHGLDDTLRCLGCGTTWRERALLDYANLHTLRELPATHPDALVTIDEARRVLTAVKRNTLNQWVARGVVRPAVDEHGRTRRDVRGALLYRLGDIAARVPRGAAAS